MNILCREDRREKKRRARIEAQLLNIERERYRTLVVEESIRSDSENLVRSWKTSRGTFFSCTACAVEFQSEFLI